MILPGATIGILGGGQLGRMLAVPARQLGYGVVVLAPEGDAPAAGLADHTFRASFVDTEAARHLADVSDVVTYEFENVPARLAEVVAARRPLHPSADLLAITQDRIAEHAWLHQHGVPTAPGQPVHTVADLDAALRTLGLPLRLKSARGGYDGGGQWRVTDDASAAVAREVVAQGGAWLAEAEVRFHREVSVVVCRNEAGQTEVFPLFENRHRDGILVLSSVPADVSAEHAAQALGIAHTLADAARLVGTLTVECFDTPEGIVVNELAPRVHNSGHLTIEATAVSQFEQHIRAICGLPLRAPELRSAAAMANLLGVEERRRIHVEGVDLALTVPGAHVHIYGKTSVRARRKMGHVTVLAETAALARERATEAVGHLHFA